MGTPLEIRARTDIHTSEIRHRSFMKSTVQKLIRGKENLIKKDAVLLFCMAIAGLLVNLNAPSIFFGARLLFGSTFSLLAFLLYRRSWGVAVAVPSSLATILMFGDPLTAIRLLGEISAITWVNRKPDSDKGIREGRVIRQIALFSLLVGCPFILLTETYLLGSELNVAVTLAYKNFANSVFNILVAYTIYSCIELKRNQRKHASRHQISIRTLISIVLMLTTILLSFGLISREFTIAVNKAQMLVIQRNNSLGNIMEMLFESNLVSDKDELSSIVIDNAENKEKSAIQTSANKHESNEYDLVIKEGRLRILKPSSEAQVRYRFRIASSSELVQVTESFFTDTLPGLTEIKSVELVSPDLQVIGPSKGSKLDRLTNSYWIYRHPETKTSELKDFVIVTRLTGLVNSLSESTNAALNLLAIEVLITLVFTKVVAGGLSKEWASIIPKKKRGATEESEGYSDSLYTASPISELNASVQDINRRTSQIIEDKKKIEYLSSMTQRQLNTAAEIQDYFLIKSFPDLESYEVSALTQPAYDVGGDWYDAFAIGRHSFFVVADVCDKGVGSALFMSVFRTLVRYTTKLFYAKLETSDTSQALIEIITGVNKYVSNNHSGCMYFATVFFAHIHEDTSEMHYVSSGHESVIIRRASGEQVLLEATGPALGLFPGAEYRSGSCSFENGDTLLAYTDGVTDARNQKNESYGIERLKSFFDDIHELSVENIRDKVMLALTSFMDGAEQFDDITVMLLRRMRPAGSEAGIPVESGGAVQHKSV